MENSNKDINISEICDKIIRACKNYNLAYQHALMGLNTGDILEDTVQTILKEVFPLIDELNPLELKELLNELHSSDEKIRPDSYCKGMCINYCQSKLKDYEEEQCLTGVIESLNSGIFPELNKISSDMIKNILQNLYLINKETAKKVIIECCESRLSEIHKNDENVFLGR